MLLKRQKMRYNLDKPPTPGHVMTTNEAAAYLDELGLSLPQPLLAAIIAQIDTINGCLAEYPEATQNLIRYYLLC